MTLHSMLQRHSGPLIVTNERTYTSADIDRDSARVAAWLRARGFARGDRAVVDLRNGADAVAALFGISRAGGIVVGATPHWTISQIQHVIADSGARFLVTNEQRVKQLGDSAPAHCLISPWSLDEHWDDVIDVSPNDPAILIYTSGSTGAPKGVVHPHRNLVDFGRIVAGYLENTAEDRLLWVLGWSFGYGLSQLLSMCWSGGRLIVPDSMLPADVMKAHTKHAATGFAQVPFGWDQLVTFLEKTGRTLDGLRYVTNAGDGPSPALLERVQRVLPGTNVVLMYGQTECLRTTFLPPDQFEEKRGAIGYAIPGVEVFVVNGGKRCEPGEPGELLHRGALLSPGYWNAPEATAKKLRPEPCLGDDRPVLHSGDIVRADADGCLWYVGRSERVIKSSGFRFGPSEIEAILAADPAIREAVVFGVEDTALGQAVEAAVVPRRERTPNASELLLAVKKRLPRYMLPRKIHFVEELPRNARGKISLAALRALA
jgi:acyl-CoA synthetase (AMP-forming)/AMP-acid ligase II